MKLVPFEILTMYRVGMNLIKEIIMKFDKEVLRNVLEDCEFLYCFEEIVTPDDEDVVDRIENILLNGSEIILKSVLEFIEEYHQWFRSLGPTDDLPKGVLIQLDEEDFSRRKELGFKISELLSENNLIQFCE
jgi:hypothetical protein